MPNEISGTRYHIFYLKVAAGDGNPNLLKRTKPCCWSRAPALFVKFSQGGVYKNIIRRYLSYECDTVNGWNKTTEQLFGEQTWKRASNYSEWVTLQFPAGWGLLSTGPQCEHVYRAVLACVADVRRGEGKTRAREAREREGWGRFPPPLPKLLRSFWPFPSPFYGLPLRLRLFCSTFFRRRNNGFE